MASVISILKEKTWTIWFRWIGFAVVLGGLGFYLTRVDFYPVKNALKQANLAPIFISSLLILIWYFVRAILLWMILKLKGRVRLLYVSGVTFVGGMVDQLIPARAGTLVRWGLLSSKFKGEKAYVFSSIAALFVLEGITLLALFFGVFLFDKSVLNFAPPLLVIGFICLVSIVAVILIFSKPIEKFIGKDLLAKISPIKALFDIAHKAREPYRFLMWTFIACSNWILQFYIFYLCGMAFNLEFTVTQLVLITTILCLAVAFPLVPANIGTVELILVWALVQMGFSEGPALAFAIVYHAVEVFPIIIAGGLSLIFLPAKKLKWK